jgi:hypothetical protein
LGERRWDAAAFLNHVIDRCRDPQAAKVAMRSLERLRQGRYQPFREFLQEFEVLQSKAETNGRPWNDEMKILALERTLHEDLQAYLVGLEDQPNDDYGAYTRRVSALAARLEAVPGRELGADLAARKSYMATISSGPGPLAPTTATAGLVDADGDTIMINRIAAAMQRLGIGALGNNNNGGRNRRGRPGNHHNPNRAELPPAPWRPETEFRALIARGVCSRCTRPGHVSRSCPTYRPPFRVNNVETQDLLMDFEPPVPGNA